VGKCGTGRWCESRNFHLGILKVLELVFAAVKIGFETSPRLTRLAVSGGRLDILILMPSKRLSDVAAAVELEKVVEPVTSLRCRSRTSPLYWCRRTELLLRS